MVEGDIFREIDDELRREQYARLWDKYGYLVVGAALAIVVSVAGYKYWNYRQANQAQTYGTRYTKALDLANANAAADKAKAQAELEAISKSGPRGYAMLAGLKKAAMEASAGKTDVAVSEFDRLAKSGGVVPIFKEFSRIQAAMLRLDKADEAEMKSRLSDLADGNGAWRHSARELLGLAAYKAGDMQGAEEQYNNIADDPQTPGGMRQRAQMMLALINEASAGKAAPKPAPLSSAAAPKATPEAPPKTTPKAAGGKK